VKYEFLQFLNGGEMSTVKMCRISLVLPVSFLIFSVCIGFQGICYGEGMGEREIEYLREGMKNFNLSLEELNFDKKWATDDTFRLSIVTKLMDDPLKVPAFISQEGQLCDSVDLLSLSKFQVHMADLIDGSFSKSVFGGFSPADKKIFHSEALTPELNRAVSIVLSSFDKASPYLEKGLRNLSEREKKRILVNGPILWCEDTLESKSLKGILFSERGLEYDTTDLETDSLLRYITRVDRQALQVASFIVHRGVEEAVKILSETDCQEEGYLFDGTVDHGRIAVGGKGSDLYDGEYCLIIDMDGDDRYTGRCASGIGILVHPFSVVIDLSGNDTYDSRKVCNFGSGIFGCGILFDRRGNDVYRGFHHVFGAGLFGTGILIDGDGYDFYEGGYFTEGAGFVGVGILFDGGGDDIFRSFDWTQGFGSIFGYGLLLNRGGDDIYAAGGKYTHAPLRPKDYRSFAQGFGMGFRPDAGGGIGFLYDSEGNDFYNAEVYAQATSYWYSIGMLLDADGNDYYNACQYSQGAGIHLSIGILMDEGGNDHYYSRYGPAQGEGHDLAVGFLIDKRGNDGYMVSGGQGIGLTNSCGIFVDYEGNDLYASSENIGQGSATRARGFGGIGAFLDLGGRDTYPASQYGKDESVWSDGDYGIGMDVESAEQPEEPEFVQRDTLGDEATIERLYEVSSLWEVGDNRKRVRNARERFIAMGMEAVKYVIENSMETKSGLELRTIEELAKEHPDSIEPFLLELVTDESRKKRGNAIWLLGKIKAKESVEPLIDALGKKRNWRLRNTIIGALGDIEDSKAMDVIAPYLKDEKERVRITSARALGKIKDEGGIPDLIAGFDDRFFTVRLACENSLVSIGDPTVSPLIETLEKTEKSMVTYHIISVLGRIAHEADSLLEKETRLRIKRVLIPFLEREEGYLRAQAVNALGMFEDPDIEELLENRKGYETDPFVLGVYRRYVE
jgi:HEAT repeat protein